MWNIRWFQHTFNSSSNKRVYYSSFFAAMKSVCALLRAIKYNSNSFVSFHFTFGYTWLHFIYYFSSLCSTYLFKYWTHIVNRHFSPDKFMDKCENYWLQQMPNLVINNISIIINYVEDSFVINSLMHMPICRICSLVISLMVFCCCC